MRGAGRDIDHALVRSRFRFKFRKTQRLTGGNINKMQPYRYNVGSLRNKKKIVDSFKTEMAASLRELVNKKIRW